MTGTALSSPLTLPAPAKLNLFLHITGRRADGYHELQTLFRLVDLCDEIQLTLTSTAVAVLTEDSDGPAQNNLAVRAAQAMLDALGETRGVRVRVRKHIPQGGLGGGSSDAATVLHGLNALLGAPFDTARLAELGLRLGADVPVFVYGQTAWGEGIGDRLTPVSLAMEQAAALQVRANRAEEKEARAEEKEARAEENGVVSIVDEETAGSDSIADSQDWYVIVAPGCEVSTAEVFAHPSLTRNSPVITMRDFFLHGARNDCQSLVRRLYPAVDAVIKWLSRWGDARASPDQSHSDQACLSGTGSCVFLRVASRAHGQALMQLLERELPKEQRVPQVWRAWVVQGLDRSPVFAALPMLRS